jgi:raffinose/stachyose/melibiose transport system permease protein
MTSPAKTGRRFDPAPLYKALFLTLVAAFVAVPLIATVLGGFKTLGELRTNPFGLPESWEWQNYWSILASQRYWVLLRNSLIIARSVPLTLLVASMAGFVFAHLKFFGGHAPQLPHGGPAGTPPTDPALFIRCVILACSTPISASSCLGAFSLAMSILLFRRFFRTCRLLDAA